MVCPDISNRLSSMHSSGASRDECVDIVPTVVGTGKKDDSVLPTLVPKFGQRNLAQHDGPRYTFIVATDDMNVLQQK